MKHLGLRARFISLLALLLFILFSLLIIALVKQNTATLKDNLNEQSRAFATLATKPIADTFLLYQDSGRVRITQQAVRFYELNKDIKSVSVIKADGKVEYTYGSDRRKHIAIQETAGFDAQYVRNSDGVITQIIQPYIEDTGNFRYALVYTISTERIDQQILGLTLLLVGLGGLLMVLSLVVLYVVFNISFIRPVREVSRLAGVISAGNLEQQIVIKSRDEIGELAAAVNTMSNKLKADIVQLQETDRLKNEFIMISSHNLRTPLTVINGYMDMIKTLDIGQQLQEFLAIIAKNTEKLSKLTEDMLTISTVESGGALTSGSSVALKPLLVELADEFQPQLTAKKVHFVVHNDLAGQLCQISKSHFKSAVWNVLDNALKFTPEDGTVTLAASVRDERFIITITDTGMGISDAELPLLFTKFHRGTDTLQYEYEGVGIGLYLTKIIIDQFKGSVRIDSKKDHGTTFTITLPVAPEEAASRPPTTPSAQSPSASDPQASPQTES